MSLEEAGIPTVALHTNVFARLAKATALANGMPTTRQAYVPQPVVDRSAADLRAYAARSSDLGDRRISLRAFFAFDQLRTRLGDQAKAARMLKLTPRQIGYALRKFGIEIKRL